MDRQHTRFRLTQCNSKHAQESAFFDLAPKDVQTSTVLAVKYSGSKTGKKQKPGTVRDAIIDALAYRLRGATSEAQIEAFEETLEQVGAGTLSIQTY
jgi:hypothetical protein